MDLLNDIHGLVEKYLEQELAAMIPPEIDDEAEVLVMSDSEGDDVDTVTGDIWDVEAQEIIGQKDLKTGKKTWFNEDHPTPEVVEQEEEETNGEEEDNDAEEKKDASPPPPKKKTRTTNKSKGSTSPKKKRTTSSRKKKK
jgi:hypothetical protein